MKVSESGEGAGSSRQRLRSGDKERLRAETARLQEPILQRLKAVGVAVVSLDDLLKQAHRSRIPLPIVDIVRQVLSESVDAEQGIPQWRNQELLVRILGRSEGAYQGDELVRLFQVTERPTLKWAIASAIAESNAVLPPGWIEERTKDPESGIARQMLVLALVRHVPLAVARPILYGLFGELPGHVARALEEAGEAKDLEVLRSKDVGSMQAWERAAINRAVKKIQKRLLVGT